MERRAPRLRGCGLAAAGLLGVAAAVPTGCGSVEAPVTPARGSPQAGYVAQQRVLDPDLPIRGRDLVQFGVDGHRLGPMPGT